MFALLIVLRHLLPDTAFATYTYMLVSYHLVLGFKILTADKEAGRSMPLGQTLLYHAAFLGVVIGLGVGRHSIPFFWLIRYMVPGLAPFEAKWLFDGEKKRMAQRSADQALQAATFGPVLVQEAASLASPAPVAVALTSGAAAQVAAPAVEAVAATVPAPQSVTPAPQPAAPTQFGAGLAFTSTGEQYDEFLKLMQQGKRPFRKPGISVMQEYELWLAHRAAATKTAATQTAKA